VKAWLRTQREALGMSRANLADALGVSPRTIANWETGRTTMNAERYAQLRRYLRARGRARVKV
jgi:transcriptional regulator with XRE-family HTH domain